MKILFFMRHYSYLSHYEEVVRALKQKGHEIHFAFNRLPRKPFDETRMKTVFSIPGITFDFFPDLKRSGFWAPAADLNRRLIDYLRYFHPDYEKASGLKRRAKKRLPEATSKAVSFMLKLAPFKFWIHVLKKIETLIPVHPAARSYVLRHNPQLVLYTPLLDSNTDFIDYAKATKALGIKSGICVASWDNLTNKGLIQVETDRVMVWNDFQKKEAVKYHGIPEEKIVITGAQTFDQWFEMKPVLSKHEFLKEAGLAGCDDFLVYVCSSGFIAPDETKFIREWLKEIRRYPVFNRIGVLIRPHPANPQSWQVLQFENFSRVSIYPQWDGFPLPFSDHDRNTYFQTLYYASAAVGLNTSAMIEAGIHNKPVLTVVTPEFKKSQEETLHFSLLKDHGLLWSARNLEEHGRQLESVLTDPEQHADRRRAFIKTFVRPHGLNFPSGPYLIQAIENLERRHAEAASLSGNISWAAFLMRWCAQGVLFLGVLLGYALIYPCLFLWNQIARFRSILRKWYKANYKRLKRTWRPAIVFLNGVPFLNAAHSKGKSRR